MNPTLVILAAGMGSRYGGLKQMDAFGPGGESIIDYSLYDAIKAGFGKIVFVIRESFEESFKEKFNPILRDLVEVEYVNQELDQIPKGISVDSERTKPWGTAHAVLVAEKAVNNQPFAVINADDYYGVSAYTDMIHFFQSNLDPNVYSFVGYQLENTLSDYGSVNRGVCITQNNYLQNIVEIININKSTSGRISYPKGTEEVELDPKTVVSMNFWGFKPSFFAEVSKYFETFLIQKGHELRSEYYIPLAIDELIRNEFAKVEMLSSEAQWFGVTYQEDKPMVKSRLNDLISKGIYPENLWAK